MEYFYKEFFIKRRGNYFYLCSNEFGNGFTFSNFNVDVQICENSVVEIGICLDCFGLESFILTGVFFLDFDNNFDNVRFTAVVSEKDIEYLFS